MTRQKTRLTLNRLKRHRRTVLENVSKFSSPVQRSPWQKKMKIGTPSSALKHIRLPLARAFQNPNFSSILVSSPKTTSKTRCRLFNVDETESSLNIFPLEGSLDISATSYEPLSPIPSNISDEDKVSEPGSKFPVCEENNDIALMIKLIPTVVARLRDEGVNEMLIEFFNLVSEDRFPLSNIAFRLWLEVVQWYKLENTTAMRYHDETKKFWKLGWRIFGGKFLRFMSGFKHETQVQCGHVSRGLYSPESSEVNFVVPDVSVLRDFSPFGASYGDIAREPGIYADAICEAGKGFAHTSGCLTFDGKKLKQGLTEYGGDVNLLGFEDKPTLIEKQEHMRSVIHSVRNTVHILTSLQQDMDLTSIPESTRKDIHISLQEYLVCLGKYAQCARKIKEKKEYALKKFLERSGPDWRNGQFVYVISSIKAFIYDIDGFLIKYEALLDDMRLDMAAILGKHEFELYICGKEVAVDGLLNYHALGNCHEEDDTRYIKQRTPRWHEIRETAKVTGSTLYKACGLDTLKRHQEHFDQVVCGIKGRDVSPQTKENMQYGTDNEINA